MRKNSVKNRRINDEVQRALSEILRELKDPRVSSLTSVMAVDVAPDLKTCKVWVSIYGSKEEIDNTMAVINLGVISKMICLSHSEFRRKGLGQNLEKCWYFKKLHKEHILMVKM